MGGLQNIMKQMQQAGGPGGLGGLGDMAGLAEAMKYVARHAFLFSLTETVLFYFLSSSSLTFDCRVRRGMGGMGFVGRSFFFVLSTPSNHIQRHANQSTSCFRRGMMGRGAGKRK